MLYCIHLTATGELIATDPERVPCLACPPTHDGAWCGSADTTAAVAHEGARTVPPREHGGNCDIKNLSRGSKIYFPVYVPGTTCHCSRTYNNVDAYIKSRAASSAIGCCSSASFALSALLQ
jgi:Acetamidase/Formamidase family